MTAIRFYGGQHCRACETVRALVDATGRDVRERDALAEPLTWDELKHLAALAGGARHIISVQAPAYRTLRLGGPGVADPALLGAMTREPSLLRHPILLVDDVVLVGFDAERGTAEHGSRP